MQAGQFQCVVPAIHSLEATQRPTLSLVKPVIGKLEQKFDVLAKISYRLNGEKKVTLSSELHPAVMDAMHIFSAGSPVEIPREDRTRGGYVSGNCP